MHRSTHRRRFWAPRRGPDPAVHVEGGRAHGGALPLKRTDARMRVGCDTLFGSGGVFLCFFGQAVVFELTGDFVLFFLFSGSCFWADRWFCFVFVLQVALWADRWFWIVCFFFWVTVWFLSGHPYTPWLLFRYYSMLFQVTLLIIFGTPLDSQTFVQECFFYVIFSGNLFELFRDAPIFPASFG